MIEQLQKAIDDSLTIISEAYFESKYSIVQMELYLEDSDFMEENRDALNYNYGVIQGLKYAIKMLKENV